MSLFINNTEDRSELQKRIAAELAEKAKRRTKDVDLEPQDIDGVEDSEYIKGYQKSKLLSLDRTWWVLIIVAIVAVVAILVLSMGGK
jgi:hypothetical protein